MKYDQVRKIEEFFEIIEILLLEYYFRFQSNSAFGILQDIFKKQAGNMHINLSNKL